MSRFVLPCVVLLQFAAMEARSAPRPKADPVAGADGGPVRIDFTPLDGQRGPNFMVRVRVEQNGKEVYQQAFQVSGPAQSDEMVRSIGDTLKRAGFEIESSGRTLTVKAYKGSDHFVLRPEVSGLPGDAPKLIAEPVVRGGPEKK